METGLLHAPAGKFLRALGFRRFGMSSSTGSMEVWWIIRLKLRCFILRVKFTRIYWTSDPLIEKPGSGVYLHEAFFVQGWSTDENCLYMLAPQLSLELEGLRGEPGDLGASFAVS